MEEMDYKKIRFKKRTCMKQYEILVDFIEKHPELVTNKTSETFKAKHRRALWNEVTCYLNSTSTGPQKSILKWQKTWSDFKHSTRTKAARCLKHPDSFRELTKLEQRVVRLCKWNTKRGLDSVFEDVELVEMEEEEENHCPDDVSPSDYNPPDDASPEKNSPGEIHYLIELPSTSSAGPREEVVPNILYISSANKEQEAEEENTVKEKNTAKEKKQDVTLEDIKERLETQNNLITEGINFVREIAKSQKKIADAEHIKAEALSELASVFREFLEGFKK